MRWFVKFVCLVWLSILSFTASALDINISRYKVYEADLNGDGKLDYYFQGKQLFVPLHGDIMIPIVLPAPASLTIYSYGTQYFVPVEESYSEAELLIKFLQPSSASSASLQTVVTNAVVPRFDFNTQAPAEFNYSLTASNVPDVGAGQLVGTTQGKLAINNGIANYSVQLDLPPAVRDLKPNLSLNYNSRSGNGLMGVGWSLNGLSAITRCRTSFATEGAEAQKSNPRYSVGDRLCLDGQKLVVASSTTAANDSAYWTAGTEYKTELDNFAKIVAYGSSANGGHGYFKVWTKDGRILTYGAEENSQASKVYATNQSAGPIKTWALDKVEDAYGNSYTITYERDTTTGEHYPLQINLGTTGSVVFSYQSRTGQTPWGYDVGNKYQFTKVLDKVTTYVGSTQTTPIKQYDIDYKISTTTNRELVDKIVECGYESGTQKCARPLTFDWQAGELGFESTPYPVTSNAVLFEDFNGDGYVDAIGKTRLLSWGSATGNMTAADYEEADSFQVIQTHQGKAAIRVIRRVQGSTKYLDVYLSRMAPSSSMSSQLITTVTVGESEPIVEVVDWNNDGLTDLQIKNQFWIQQANASFMSPSGNAVDATAIFAERSYVDVNNDGLLDYTVVTFNGWIQGSDYNNTLDAYFSTGTHFDGSQSFGRVNNNPLLVRVPGVGSSYAPIHLSMRPSLGFWRTWVDINGDGNPDVLYRDSHSQDPNIRGKWAIKLSVGKSVSHTALPLVSTGIWVAPMSGGVTAQYSFVTDYNKDGVDDFIVFFKDSSAAPRMRVFYGSYINGALSFINSGVDPFMGKLDYLVELEPSLAESVGETIRPFRGDVNNDGIMDLVVNGQAYLGKQQQPDLINKITDGFGAETKIAYSPLVGDANNGSPLYTPDNSTPVFPLAPINRATQVVKQVSASNGQSGFNHTYFNYTGGVRDLLRGSSGFKSIVITNAATNTVAITEYLQDWPYNGRIKKQTIKETSGKLISISENSYTLHSQNARFAYLSFSLQKNYALAATSESAPVSVSKITNIFDTCGNLTEQASRVGTGFSGVEVTGELNTQSVVNVYDYNNTSACHDDFLTSNTQTVAKTGNTESKSIVTEFTPNSQRDVHSRTDFKGETIQKTVTYGREANGIINQITEAAKDIDGSDAPARITTLSNFVYGMYPQTVVNAENHSTSFTYDYRFGSVATQTFLGLTAANTYDALGRLRQQQSPDSTVTKTVAFYCSNAPVTCPGGAYYGVATKVTNDSQSGKLGKPLQITFYDKLQREVRGVAYSLNGKVINQAVEYSTNGYLSRVSEPYATDGIAADTSLTTAWTNYSGYDALGRATTITGPDGGTKTTTFSFDGYGLKTSESILVIKPDSTSETQTTSSWINSLGQVTRVEDALLNTVSYSYDALGNLQTTLVNNKVATQIDVLHDLAGNKTYIKDPDAGVINFDYNGFGELRKQTWQKNIAGVEKYITYGYDKLGRQVTRTDKPASGSTVSYSWVWDTKQQGQLSSRSGNGFSEEYFYDGFSRLSRQIVSTSGLSGGEFTYTYDNFGREETVKYPNGFKIQRDYHADGYQVQTRDVTSSPRVLWALGNTIDSRGTLNKQLWGNGVVTQTGFDANSGRLSSIKSGRLSSTNTITNLYGNIQNLSYTFDSLGNLRSRTTQRTNDNGVATENITEAYSYDQLNRVKTVTTSGLFARTQTFGYDTDGLGNLTSRSDMLAGSSINNDVGELKYEQVRNAGVHAVTSAGGVNYSYDNYGNMIARGSESIIYDTFNKPTRIAGASITDFYYGPDHELYKEVSGTKTTYKLAGGLYEVIVDGTTTTQKSYVDGVILNNRVLTNGTQSANDTHYLHTDHLGSVEATTNALGQFVNRMSFGAWGKRQKSDWKPGTPTENFLTSNGFTGHDQLDNHNLVHMGGRVYDPNLGRFLSADLYIQSPYNTQSFNRYSYTFNNPLSYTDPTGYSTDLMQYFMNQYHQQSASWSWSTTVSYLKTERTLWEGHTKGMSDYHYWWETDTSTANSVSASSIFQTVSYNAPSWGAGPFRINNYEPGIQQACGGDAQCMQSMRADMAEEHFELVALAAGGEVGILGKAALEARAAKAAAAELKKAEAARDALAADLKRKHATYAGGHKNGKVTSGCSSNPSGCAEDDIARQLGSDAKMTGAKGWRKNNETGEVELRDIPVCTTCQSKYSIDQFPADIKYQPGGAWSK